MTRSELARFWDEELARWFGGRPQSSHLERWREAYAGELQEWAFPEPFIGDLLGAPRIVLLANNPGIAHEELQSRSGAFASQIASLGFTAWAATRPYEGGESEWEKRHGPIVHNRLRLEFARRFLDAPSLQFDNVLNVELYPWHSLRKPGVIKVGPDTLREFILEPLAELGADVPVVALGRDWARSLDAVPSLIERCEEFAAFLVPSRRARMYELRGARIMVVWHSGSDRPPRAEDIALLREIWLRPSRDPADVEQVAGAER